MKKILNVIIAMGYVIYPVTSKVWPAIVRLMQIVLEFVVWYRLYVRKDKIVTRPFFINDDGEMIVYSKPLMLTAAEIGQKFYLEAGTLEQLAAMPSENSMVIRDDVEGIIVTMKKFYTADEMILWHELGHVANQDLGTLRGRKLDLELGADFVAAGQVGREAAIATLARIKNEIEHYPWWLRVAGDGALEDSVLELESRIATLRRIDQKILNIFAAEAKYRVRFIDDELNSQEVA